MANSTHHRRRLYEKLDRVRRRHSLRAVVWGALFGLTWGSVAATALLAGRMAGWPIPIWLPCVVGLSLPVAVALWRLRAPISRTEMAKLIDARCGFQDHIVSALDFSNGPTICGMKMMQLQDAVERLCAVDPRRVVPDLLPSNWTRAISAVALFALMLGLAAGRENAVDRDVKPTGEVNLTPDLRQAVVVPLRQAYEALVETADRDAEPGRSARIVAQLANEIDDLLAAIDSPDVGRRQTLLSLAKMETAVDRTRRSLKSVEVKEAIRALGTVLGEHHITRPVGRALERGDLAGAASALQDVNLNHVAPETASQLNRQLTRQARLLEQSQIHPLATAIKALARELGQSQSPQESLVQLLKQYADQWVTEQQIAAQLAAIADARAAFATDKARPVSPSLVRGRDVVGTEQLLASERLEAEEVSGVMGSGPSRTETTVVVPRSAEAQRPLTARQLDQQRVESTPVDREPLPLGHRQTVRRYFQGLNEDK